MKAATERKIIRWLHIILGIPIIGYLYGPISAFPIPTMIVRWIIFPLLVVSGFWLWKGHLLRKRRRAKSTS